MKAPDDSPYRNGIFNFKIIFTKDYPLAQPKVFIKTKIFHCNIKNDGYCDFRPLKYREVYGLPTILCFLYEFFITNRPNNPFEYNLAKLYKNDYSSFEQKCKEFVSQYALKYFDNEREYLFQGYSNTKINFSNSNYTFLYIGSNGEKRQIIITKDHIREIRELRELRELNIFHYEYNTEDN